MTARGAIRGEMVSRLRADSDLTTLLGGTNRVIRRQKRTAIEARTVTYIDFGSRPDATVPMLDRVIQVDVWDTDPVRAEEIAERIDAVLDGKPFGVVTDEDDENVVNVVYLGLTGDRDGVIEDGDFERVTREYRMLAYKLK